MESGKTSTSHVNATSFDFEVCYSLRDKFGSTADNKLKPLIEELMLLPNKTSYRSVRTCDLELELTHENKGIESIQFYDAGEKGIPKCCCYNTLQQHCWLGWVTRTIGCSAAMAHV